MTSTEFYILLLAICLAALSGYFFVARTLGRIFGRIISFAAKAVMIIVLVVAATIFAPKYIHKSSHTGASSQCIDNSQKICTALEDYSKENKGTYPSSLLRLKPNFISKIPSCPAAEKDTYSRTYKVSTDHKVFTFYCSDSNHSKVKFTSKK
jgi:hypothetical protein